MSNNQNQEANAVQTIVETISDSEAYMQQKLLHCQQSLSNHIKATQEELRRNLQLNTIFGVTILIALIVFEYVHVFLSKYVM